MEGGQEIYLGCFKWAIREYATFFPKSPTFLHEALLLPGEPEDDLYRIGTA